ncbi:MAG: S-methyl-5'-thioadenosine phosphorylase [Deltaproteobacteria bacterium]|nr:MAG: S-methyl-5'-thioadenosine phosphorylase [Deltaproteobacteria bacterium]
MAKIGIIGGSGLYQMEGLTGLREEHVETPFGAPSDAVMLGELEGVELAFLPRHGRGHRLTPGEVPYRANIHALKQLGCEWVISVSAVGSLRGDIPPGHVVTVDQYIDRTRQRPTSFFGDGIVAHVSFGDPVCDTLRGYLYDAAVEAGVPAFERGTYVCIEGPSFSTRAESELFRRWGADVVGMTNLPEARLAREASLSYASLTMATDYDCWHRGHDEVSVESVIAVITQNVANAQRILKAAVARIAAHEGPAPHADALKYAVITSPDAMRADTREKLALLLDPVLVE